MLLLSLAVLAPLQLSEPRFERLNSGLRVAVVEDHTLPLVSVQLWYRVGSACDPPDRPGLCTVTRAILEHRDQAALKLRAAGLRFESRTGRDACYFASLLPPCFLEYVLDIEAARMAPLHLTADNLERGLNAAARQYAEVADDPNHVGMRRILGAMFPDHPYRHPPGFVGEALKDLSVSEVGEFLDRWFVPGNATLFVIGDVSTLQVLEQVRQRFDKLEWAEPPRRAPSPETPRETIRRWNATNCRVGADMAWACPPKGSFDNVAIDVLMHRLCNPIDGSLHQRLRQQDCSSLRWRRLAWHDGGILVLSLDGPPRLPQLVDEEIAKAAEQTWSEIEHDRARALAEYAARSRRAAFGDRALDRAEHEIVAGDLLLADFDVPRIRQVSVADVQRAALLLTESRRVAVFYGPSGGTGPGAGSIPPTEKLGDRLDLGPQERLGAGEALELLALTGAASPEPHSPGSCPEVIVRRLDSRTHLTLCAVPESGSATVRTVLPEIRKPPDILFRKLISGAEQFPADRLADYLSYRSASLLAVPNSPRAALTSECATEFIAQMMEVQASVILGGSPRGWPEQMSGLLMYIRPDCLSPVALADVMSHGTPLYDPSRGQSWIPRAVYRPLLELCGSPGEVEVYVVGDASVDEAFAAAQALWLREEESQAGPASRPAPEAPRWREYWDYPWESARPVIYWTGQNSQTIYWTAQFSPLWPPSGPEEMHIRVVLRLWEQPPDDPTGLKADAIAWLLGRPPAFPRDIDGQRAWAWECGVRDANTVVVSARTAPDRVAGELAAMLRRVTLVRSAEVPDSQVRTAIRLARAARAPLLDNQPAIADLLQRGVRTPWKLDVSLEKDQLFPLVTEPAPQARPMIHVVGGSRPPPGIERVGDFDSKVILPLEGP